MKKVFWAHSEFMKKIWDKWMKENLLQLTARKKLAAKEKQEMVVGDVVWVCDKQYHAFNYPMRKNMELQAGDNGVSRSTTVKNKQKQFERSA